MPLSQAAEGTLTLVVQYLLHLRATRALEDLDGLDVAIDCLRDSAGLKAVTQSSSALEEIVAGSGRAPEKRPSPAELKEEGNALFKAKEYTRAVRKFTEAILGSEGEPDQTRAVYYANRAAARAAVGTPEEAAAAAEDCKEAVRLYPTYHKAWYRLGQLYEAKGDVAEAHRAYGTAAASSPGSQVYQEAYRRTGAGEPAGPAGTPGAPGGAAGGSAAPGGDWKLPENAQEIIQRFPVLREIIDDPEVRALATSPKAQEVLQKMQENPLSAFGLMSDPEFGPIVSKLIKKLGPHLGEMATSGFAGFAPPQPPPGDMYV